MSKKAKVIIISAGIALALIGTAAAVVIHGAFTYTSRCAHIKPKDGITVQMGDTLSIDELAEFSNYDTRSITAVIGAKGTISEDKQHVTIEEGSGKAEIELFATNEHAPEWSDKTVTVLISGRG